MSDVGRHRAERVQKIADERFAAKGLRSRPVSRWTPLSRHGRKRPTWQNVLLVCLVLGCAVFVGVVLWKLELADLAARHHSLPTSPPWPAPVHSAVTQGMGAGHHFRFRLRFHRLPGRFLIRRMAYRMLLP